MGALPSAGALLSGNTPCTKQRGKTRREAKMKEDLLAGPGLSRRGLLRTGTGLVGTGLLGGAMVSGGLARDAYAQDKPPIGTWPAGSSGSSVFVGLTLPRTGTYAVPGEDELK